MSAEPESSTETLTERRRVSWSQRVWVLIFVIFCFEIGAFLLVFPWLQPWSNNWLVDAIPALRGLWENSYFRGALSGVGAVNIYISVLEFVRLRRALP